MIGQFDMVLLHIVIFLPFNFFGKLIHTYVFSGTASAGARVGSLSSPLIAMLGTVYISGQ